MNHKAITCRNKLELRKVVDLLLNMGYNVAVCQDIEEGNYFVTFSETCGGEVPVWIDYQDYLAMQDTDGEKKILQ